MWIGIRSLYLRQGVRVFGDGSLKSEFVCSVFSSILISNSIQASSLFSQTEKAIEKTIGK